MVSPLEYKVISLSVTPNLWVEFIGLAHAEGLTASAKIRQMVARELRGAARVERETRRAKSLMRSA